MLPIGLGTYGPLADHVGGAAWVNGSYLYVTKSHQQTGDPGYGVRVFDMNQIRAVDPDTSLCINNDQGVFGKVGSNYCAAGYKYMLPEVGEYTFTSDTTCMSRMDFLGIDYRAVTNYLLIGEWTSALNGRLSLWAYGSDGKLLTVNGVISPSKVFFMNEPYIQGVASDMAKDTNGNYLADSYWLSSSGDPAHPLTAGAIYRVTTASTAEGWYETNGQAPSVPEGMISTPTPNLWMVTEGANGATNPSNGGRALFYINGND